MQSGQLDIRGIGRCGRLVPNHRPPSGTTEREIVQGELLVALSEGTAAITSCYDSGQGSLPAMPGAERPGWELPKRQLRYLQHGRERRLTSADAVMDP